MKLLIRVDGSPAIGSGHVMRCLTLATEWNRYGQSVLVTRELSEPLRTEANRCGIPVVDCHDWVDSIRTEQPDVIVIDGYHIPDSEQEAAKMAAPTLLIDDHGRTGCIDGVDALDGNLLPGDALLAGPKYALVRTEFKPRQRTQPPEKCLVTLGSNAPTNLVEAVIRQASSLGLNTRLIIGPMQAEASVLKAQAEKAGIKTQIGSDKMASDMNWADVAILGGGTTILEAAASGLPCMVVPFVDNQQPVAAAAEVLGIGIQVQLDGEYFAQLPACLERISESHTFNRMTSRGPRLIDGRGARRACTWLRSRILKIRPAKNSDSSMVLEWANDAVTRAVSFDSNPISPADHERWWEVRMEDGHLFIAEFEEPIGFIWFRVADGVATLSVNMAPASRGKGLGPAVIRAGIDALWRLHPSAIVHAYVRHTNEASRSAFLDAAFDEVGVPNDGPQDAWLFIAEPIA